jgi:hypothetical protein
MGYRHICEHSFHLDLCHRLKLLLTYAMSRGEAARGRFWARLTSSAAGPCPGLLCGLLFLTLRQVWLRILMHEGVSSPRLREKTRLGQHVGWLKRHEVVGGHWALSRHDGKRLRCLLLGGKAGIP